nr:flagellin [Sinorhizobium medicae]
MTSILTNIAAMAALQTLRTIGSNMEETQAHVSSGLRVGQAADNAAYWSIATTMRSDNMALSAVQDALGLGAAKVDTAYSGMESAIEVVKEIKKKLVAATEDGVDKAKIQEEIDQLKDQLTSISEAASFSGENWLQADLSGGAVIKSVVGSFVRDASGAVSVKKVDYSLNTNSVLFDTVGDTGILDKVYDVSQASVTLTCRRHRHPGQGLRRLAGKRYADDQHQRCRVAAYGRCLFAGVSHRSWCGVPGQLRPPGR